MTTDLTDTLRDELERLRHSYEDLRDEIAQLRGAELGQTRRRGVLSSAGATAESVLKFMYRREGRERGGKPADKLMLEELVTTLRDVLPEHIQAPVRAVQVYRNLGAHDKGDIRHIAESAIQTVDTALSQVVVWFFQVYLGGEFAGLAEPLDSRIGPGKSKGSQSVDAWADEVLSAWRELYWWFMRGGELKRLDDMKLQSQAAKHGLCEADLEAIRKSWKRDVLSFDEVLSQALESGELEPLTMDALEHTRVLACISASEATERAAPHLGEVAGLPESSPLWLVAAHTKALAQVEAELRSGQEAEARERAEAELRSRQKAEARERAETELRSRQEAEARERAEAELRSRHEAEARERAEAELRAREAERQRARTQLRARQEAEARQRAEAELRARQEAEARQRAEAELRARQEAEARQRAEAERRARQEAEARQRAEAELRARQEAEARQRAQFAARQRAEAELKARDQAQVRQRAIEAIAARDGAPAPAWKRPWMVRAGDDSFGRWAMTTVAGVQSRLRYCPPGKFMMGASDLEEGRFDDEMQRLVELTRGFWIGETPVTQALWLAVMGKNPSLFEGPARPVERVSWEDCQRFLDTVGSHQPQLALRFPTEAEWEYACRAGTTGARYGELDAVAWHQGNAGGETRPVGQKQPNAWGLYDTLGNVWEWVQDWRADEQVWPTWTARDPQGPEFGDDRLYRGGDCLSGVRHVRAAYRDFGRPTLQRGSLAGRPSHLGFRLCRSEP
jgi:formylglycine-generating enzyme required for sulfatase activity